MALLVVERRRQRVAAVQKHALADQHGDAEGAQRGQRGEHQRQGEGGGLGPRSVHPFFHVHTALHLVALAPDHLDIPGLGWIDLELFPQVPDMDGHGAAPAALRGRPSHTWR